MFSRVDMQSFVNVWVTFLSKAFLKPSQHIAAWPEVGGILTISANLIIYRDLTTLLTSIIPNLELGNFFICFFYLFAFIFL